MRIGVDLMGSDVSPRALFEGVLQAVEACKHPFGFSLFATEEVIADLKLVHRSSLAELKEGVLAFHAVLSVIAMEDDPVLSVHVKGDSSMVTGLRSLKAGGVDAFVSAGNTGALLVASKKYLPLLSNVKRPGLLATLPTAEGSVAVLDVGANISSRAEHLLQYAFMGAAYQKYFNGIHLPRVGLLNVGGESRKGTLEHRKAFSMLDESSEQVSSRQTSFRFVGNIEGRDIFRGKVDVLVTDGFSGNVLLKGAEGAAEFIINVLQREASAKQVLTDIRKRFHYSEHPGAILCGVDGVVVKCHGEASAASMYHGILGAAELLDKGYTKAISFSGS